MISQGVSGFGPAETIVQVTRKEENVRQGQLWVHVTMPPLRLQLLRPHVDPHHREWHDCGLLLAQGMVLAGIISAALASATGQSQTVVDLGGDE